MPRAWHWYALGWFLSCASGWLVLQLLVPALYRRQARKDGTPYYSPEGPDWRALAFGRVEHSLFYVSLAVPGWATIAGAWIAAKAIDAWTRNDDYKRIYLMGTALNVLFAALGVAVSQLPPRFGRPESCLWIVAFIITVVGMFVFWRQNSPGVGDNDDCEKDVLSECDVKLCEEHGEQLKLLDRLFSDHSIGPKQYRESRKASFCRFRRHTNRGPSE